MYKLHLHRVRGAHYFVQEFSFDTAEDRQFACDMLTACGESPQPIMTEAEKWQRNMSDYAKWLHKDCTHIGGGKYNG